MKKVSCIDASTWMKSAVPDRRYNTEKRIYGEFNAPPRKRSSRGDALVKPTLRCRMAIREAAQQAGLSNHKLAHATDCQTQHAFHATTERPPRGVPREALLAMGELLGVEIEIEIEEE